MAHGHGGVREGAGRRLVGDQAESRRQYEAERARHERIKRMQREFDFAIARGEMLPREAQRSAAATALAGLAQALRSVPDLVERTLGLRPDVVEAIGIEIDKALSEASAALRAMALPDSITRP